MTVSPPPQTLFPRRAQREAWDDALTRELLNANERIAAGSVVPTFDLGTFKQELAAFDFETPRRWEELVGWTIGQIERGVVHMTHPRYFGLFNPNPTFPALAGDRIAGAFNPQLATRKTAPAAVEIEAHVIRALARRIGLPTTATGHFTSGGSEANYTSVICALTRAEARFATDGARAFSGAPVFYISRESHLAWLKIAHQAGIGRSAVRLVPTDGTGRLDVAVLEKLIAGDRAAGHVPFMIVATAGTTNAGMIDPLVPCADLAHREGLWYHVDAAWGGAIVTSDRMRGVLAGIERADSVTIDAHKWFATTMACGMFFTRHAEILSASFQASTDFMPSNDAAVDPYVLTAQWSRRFLGLRLFLALGAAGWSGYATHVERAVELIALLEKQLRARGWAIANQSSLAVLCVEPPPGFESVPAIAERVLASGRAWVAAAKFEGRPVIRICLTHGEATEADIADLAETLTRSGTFSQT